MCMCEISNLNKQTRFSWIKGRSIFLSVLFKALKRHGMTGRNSLNFVPNFLVITAIVLKTTLITHIDNDF